MKKVDFPKKNFLKSNDEIVLITINFNLVLKDTHWLFTYTQDGQNQGTVKFGPNGFASSGCYREIFYNHVTKTIIGLVGYYTELSIEYLSDETGEFQCSYLLYNTNLPLETEHNCGLKLICHVNGAMALVGKRNVIFLQSPSLT